MITFAKAVTVFFLFLFFSATAQDFQGVATYQTKTSLNIDFSKSQIPPDRLQHIQEMMKNQLEKTYDLSFNKTESIYKEEEKLDQPSSSGRGGMRFTMMGMGNSGIQYKNVLSKNSISQKEFSGKYFLVTDSLKNYHWKLEQETKMIGENLCFKASTVIEQPARNTSFRFGQRNNDKERDSIEKLPVKMEPVVVTAWYTMTIPVSQGPGDYWGLPGLILEVSAGNTQILCTKIVINPTDKLEIKEPSKGKVVTQKEYEKIVDEKRQEMRERFQNERQKNGNNTMHIRIGG